ncbi:AbrB/MazE/SpoVT family DNA-binding domain-containing protein [Sphingomonas aquatilis]
MSTRGRVTLPVELRRSLGLTGGERLSFKLRDDGNVEVTLPPASNV